MVVRYLPEPQSCILAFRPPRRKEPFSLFFFSLAKSSGLPGVDKPGPMTWPLWNLKLESISPNLMEQEWWQGGVGN